MKKLLSLLLVFILVLGLGACASSPDTQLIDLENRVNQLETQINEQNVKLDMIEDIMLNIGVIVGLGGQVVDYYSNSEYADLVSMPTPILYQRLDAMDISELIVIKDTFDKTKAPTYILDELENFISFSQLINLLVDKYFGEDIIVNDAILGTKAFMRITDNTGSLTHDDIIVRIGMMLNEMQEYEYYVGSAPETDIEYILTNGITQRIRVTAPLNVMINEFFMIEPESIYSQDYDIRLVTDNVTLDLATIESLFNQYILDDTFSGYVLNYTK